MTSSRTLATLLILCALIACPKRTTRGLPDYALGPEEHHLGGQVVGLYSHAVLNRRDFVYSIAFNRDSTLAAYPHMVLTDFQLALADVESGQLLWEVPLNSTEFDVEGVVFVPPDALVTAAHRKATSSHASLRLFGVEAGNERAAAFSDDERGYSQVALSPDAAHIAAVSAKEGNIVLHDSSSLVWRGETRAHRGPAMAVAFAPDGTIFTGGQDKTIARWRLVPAAPRASGTVRAVLLEIGEHRDRVIVGAVGGNTSGLFALGTELETTAVTRSLAERVGLPLDGPSRSLRTSAGEITATTVTLPGLWFKDLHTAPIPAVVCDECVPPGSDGALGADLEPRVRVTPGPLPHIASVEVTEGSEPPAAPTPDPASPPAEPASPATSGAAGDVGGTSAPSTSSATASAAPGDVKLWQLELVERFVMTGPVNDIRVSKDGKRLCVALSSEPAERSLELYEREKNDQYPEASPKNAAVLVDAEQGTVLKIFTGHRGYVVTADLSPDGRTVASGGWDNHVLLFDVESGAQVAAAELEWLARRVRFSPDARTLGVAAWTPPNSGGGDSEPAAILYDIVYAEPEHYPR